MGFWVITLLLVGVLGTGLVIWNHEDSTVETLEEGFDHPEWKAPLVEIQHDRIEPELINACYECVRNNKVFLRYDTAAGVTIKDFECLAEKELRGFGTGDTTIKTFICDEAECEYPYIGYKYRMEQIVCAIDNHYPSYLRNVQGQFPGFDIEGLTKYVEDQSTAWNQLTADLANIQAQNMCPCPTENNDDTKIEPTSSEKYGDAWKSLYNHWYNHEPFRHTPYPTPTDSDE